MVIDDIQLRPEMFLGRVFRPQGTYSARIEDGVIHSQIKGPLNRELIQLYRDAVGPLWREAAESGQFVILAHLSDSMLITADAFDSFIQATASLCERVPQFSAIAQVAPIDIEGRELMSKLYRTRVYGPLAIPYEIFEHEKEALVWLQDILKNPTTKV